MAAWVDAAKSQRCAKGKASKPAVVPDASNFQKLEVRNTERDISPLDKPFIVEGQMESAALLDKAGVGIRDGDNIFLRMAYSSPVQVAQEAALLARRSPIYGISAPLMLGTVPRIGSLYNEVAMDGEFIRANFQSVDNILDDL